jgi:ATP-GRASP peptide maturase of grasp-with-spasm system
MSKKIILSNRSDVSTNEVIDWLEYFDLSYERFNGENFIDNSLIEVILNNECLSYRLGSWYGDESTKNKIWFRRFFPYDYYEELNSTIRENHADILTNVFSEINTVFKFAMSIDADNDDLGRRNINKLVALNNARKVGLNIPKTLVTTCKNKLTGFKNDCGRIILKPLSDSLSFRASGFSGAVYTTEIDEEKLKQFNDRFFVSLFQELLEKSFEIRVFYFDFKLYSMAIFSQQNEQTNVDFRKYDDNRPNRTVPYKLPIDVEHKIQLLMKDLNLASGSIDIVRTKDGRFVFLEVNPVGQFGMVSYPCNYKLEKIIAQKIGKL